MEITMQNTECLIKEGGMMSPFFKLNTSPRWVTESISFEWRKRDAISASSTGSWVSPSTGKLNLGAGIYGAFLGLNTVKGPGLQK